MKPNHSSSLFLDRRLSRRELLRRASNGFGAMAMAALLGGKASSVQAAVNG
jgi:hypothetical protein